MCLECRQMSLWATRTQPRHCLVHPRDTAIDDDDTGMVEFGVTEMKRFHWSREKNLAEIFVLRSEFFGPKTPLREEKSPPWIFSGQKTKKLGAIKRRFRYFFFAKKKKKKLRCINSGLKYEQKAQLG